MLLPPADSVQALHRVHAHAPAHYSCSADAPRGATLRHIHPHAGSRLADSHLSQLPCRPHRSALVWTRRSLRVDRRRRGDEADCQSRSSCRPRYRPPLSLPAALCALGESFRSGHRRHHSPFFHPPLPFSYRFNCPVTGQLCEVDPGVIRTDEDAAMLQLLSSGDPAAPHQARMQTPSVACTPWTLCDVAPVVLRLRRGARP